LRFQAGFCGYRLGMTPDSPDALARLRAIVHRLRSPGGCPWDREQTHESLIPHVLEEAYEVVDAIRSGDPDLLCEELGDLLLQPVLHAEIAAETGRFDLDRMADRLSVFGEVAVTNSGEVLTQWDAIKRQEKGLQKEGHLHGTGTGLPALMRAQKLQKKAARVGFDWPDVAPVFAKIREETTELEQAVTHGERVAVEDEVGDLLFSVVNLARKLGVEAEAALAAANEKFTRRFHAVEARLADEGKALGQATLDEMDAVWEQVKHSA
jgi:MazG family protein